MRLPRWLSTQVRKWFPGYIRPPTMPERRKWQGVEAWLLPMWRYAPRTVMFLYRLWKIYLQPLPREIQYRNDPPGRFLDALENNLRRAPAFLAEREAAAAPYRERQLRIDALREASQQRDGPRLQNHVIAILNRFIGQIGAAGKDLSVDVGNLQHPRLPPSESTRIFVRHQGKAVVQLYPRVADYRDPPGTEGALWASYDDDRLARMLGILQHGPEPDGTPRSQLRRVASYLARVVNDIAIQPGWFERTQPKPAVPQTSRPSPAGQAS
ncbi:MAG TPA: hypothetical protein VHA70_02570 [Bauldia sp.]|nr:hypothetical protein [Bauldia sp.]